MKRKVRKQGPRTFWIHVPIWNANLYVYVGGDFSEFREWCCGNTPFPEGRIYNDMFRPEGANATTYFWQGDAVVYAPVPVKRSVLVHELLHFALQLLRRLGVEETDDEVRCYLMEWLYEYVVERMTSGIIKEETK